MRVIKIILLWVLLAGAPILGHCADAESSTLANEVTKEEQKIAKDEARAEKHELSPDALGIGKTGKSFITSSMVVSWIVAVVLIVFARYATKNIQAVPSGAQNFWEFLVESLHDFLEGIIGADLVKKTFWFFASAFIIILFTNWFGLIPGVGTIGWGDVDAKGHFEISNPLLRGGNADLNMTLAMSMIFFACWIVWAFQANGMIGMFLHLFGPKGESTGFLKVLLIVVFFLVGFLEILSILFRPISLSFRLYGNIFAGENMLESMANLVPHFGWLLPVPFYFMELLVGVVQALVFMLLTAVFTMLICMHEDDGHGHAHGGTEHAH